MDLSSVMNAAGPDDDAQPAASAHMKPPSPPPQGPTPTLEELATVYEATKRDYEALARRHTAVQQELQTIRAENEYLIGELGQYAPSDLESDQSDVEFAPPRPAQLSRPISVRRGQASVRAMQSKKTRARASGRGEDGGSKSKRKRPTASAPSSAKSTKPRNKKPKTVAME